MADAWLADFYARDDKELLADSRWPEAHEALLRGLESGEIRPLTSTPDHTEQDHRVSPDGAQIALLHDPETPFQPQLWSGSMWMAPTESTPAVPPSRPIRSWKNARMLAGSSYRADVRSSRNVSRWSVRRPVCSSRMQHTW